MRGSKDTLIGERFYYLTVARFAGSWALKPGWLPNRHWECRCDCGGTVIVTTQYLTDGRTRHCPDCEPDWLGWVYLKHYREYRDAFTAEQRNLYESLLRGRKGTRVEAEAVDVTLRVLPPGERVHESILGVTLPLHSSKAEATSEAEAERSALIDYRYVARQAESGFQLFHDELQHTNWKWRYAKRRGTYRKFQPAFFLPRAGMER